MLTNFYKRFLTSLILIPAVVFGVFYFRADAVGWLVLGVLFLSTFEWSRLVFKSPLSLFPRLAWFGMGEIYIVSACFALVSLPLSVGQHLVHWAFLSILCLAWISDSAGYFVGKFFGGPKLCPRISPGKTWSGAAGSVFFTALLGGALLFAYNAYILHPYFMLKGGSSDVVVASFLNVRLFLVAGLASIVGQLGDLLQSWAKRSFGVKDSGSFFPAHGGVLDRLDAVFSIALFLFLLEFLGLGVIAKTT